MEEHVSHQRHSLFRLVSIHLLEALIAVVVKEDEKEAQMICLLGHGQQSIAYQEW